MVEHLPTMHKGPGFISLASRKKRMKKKIITDPEITKILRIRGMYQYIFVSKMQVMYKRVIYTFIYLIITSFHCDFLSFRKSNS
jgi:hypothetical protein